MAARDDISRLQDMPKMSEFYIVEALYSTVRNELTDAIKPEEILGAQFLSQKRTWVINFTCLDAKVKAISVGRVVVGTRSYGILDFQKTGLKKTEIRISIHGIPHSVTDEEVAQWVDSRAERTTEVMRHQKRNRNADSPFQHLYSGHRFCYVSRITNTFQRYTSYSIPDPTDTTSLMDIDVTVFHDGQQINCKSCKAEDHAFHECPHRVTCHQCGKKGHIRKWCRAEKNNLPRESAKDVERIVQQGLKAARHASKPRPAKTARAAGNNSEDDRDWASRDPDEGVEAAESSVVEDSGDTDDENTEGRSIAERKDKHEELSSEQDDTVIIDSETWADEEDFQQAGTAKFRAPQQLRSEHHGRNIQRRRTRSTREPTTNTRDRVTRSQTGSSAKATRERKDVLTRPEKNKHGKLYKDDQRKDKDTDHDDQRRKKDIG
ncbi:Hypp9608 [Branchiostoma lanceolatum]|uniref:Hypp9608 protein n=1 Tax=Branchiostoma lanceolatum TaxID=7740 RepID=A0A8S4MNT7_BRALA|nr:Hypp9608 [Branchiostoma lanceolatum]